MQYPRAIKRGKAHSTRKCPNFRCCKVIHDGDEVIRLEVREGVFSWVCVSCGSLAEEVERSVSVSIPADLAERIEYCAGLIGSSFFDLDGDKLGQITHVEPGTQADLYDPFVMGLRELWDLAGELERYRVAQNA